MPKYIVTNFAYGTGPYLMTTKLAIAFNDELEKAGRERMKIIVPLVYGDKQKKIMAEEDLIGDEFILDEKLGAILKKAFYQNESFQEYLDRWINDFEALSQEAHDYLLEKYGNDILIELNRSPRLIYNVARAYSASFGMLGKVFKDNSKIAGIYKKIEEAQKMITVGYPGLSAEGAVLVPPIGPMPSEIPPPTGTPFMKGSKNPSRFQRTPFTKGRMKKGINSPFAKGGADRRGIYVTKTGISGLERLYDDAEKLGLKVYSNKDYHPNILMNKNIMLHFARSGWASVWLSLLAEKPIVVPKYDLADDPEIDFNNKIIEKLKIGIVYQGESLKEIIQKSEQVKLRQQEIKKEILDKWGTLDGTRYCAKLFVKDFLGAK